MEQLLQGSGCVKFVPEHRAAGKIAEINESKIGKVEFNTGHCDEGEWVFGGV